MDQAKQANILVEDLEGECPLGKCVLGRSIVSEGSNRIILPWCNIQWYVELSEEKVTELKEQAKQREEANKKMKQEMERHKKEAEAEKKKRKYTTKK
jgi:hypothetical protein